MHAIGRRYAGFTWELVDQLKNTYSDDGAFDLAKRLVMAAALANPSNIPDAVRLSILADDDDGDLGTCSPHQRELEAAAELAQHSAAGGLQRSDGLRGGLFCTLPLH